MPKVLADGRLKSKDSADRPSRKLIYPTYPRLLRAK